MCVWKTIEGQRGVFTDDTHRQECDLLPKIAEVRTEVTHTMIHASERFGNMPFLSVLELIGASNLRDEVRVEFPKF